MTLILFRSELNYSVCKCLYESFWFSLSTMIKLSSVFYKKVYPMCLAKLTRASSSGDEELYSPFSFITLWHIAKCNRVLWLSQFYSLSDSLSFLRSSRNRYFSDGSKSTCCICFFSSISLNTLSWISLNVLPLAERPSVMTEDLSGSDLL